MVLTEGKHKYTVQKAVERTIYFAENCASHEDVDYVEVIVKGNHLEVNYTKDDGNPHYKNHKDNWSRFTLEDNEEISSAISLIRKISRDRDFTINGNRTSGYDPFVKGFYFHQ